MDNNSKPKLWWWAGDETSARRRFSERFQGREATIVEHPHPGIIALGPIEIEPEALSTPQPKLFEVQTHV